MKTYSLYQRAFVFSCLLWLASLPATAQTTVTVDLNTLKFDKALPFDEVFLLKGSVPKGVKQVTARWTRKKDSKTATWRRGDSRFVSPNEFVVEIGPLRPDRIYTFSFALSTSSSSSASSTTYSVSLTGTTPAGPFTGSIKAPLSVKSTSPANGASRVLWDAKITLNFSEQVTVTANGVSVTCGGNTVAFSGLPVSNLTDSVVLTPTSPLPAGNQCRVMVTGAQVSDAANNKMTTDHTFTFTTEAAPQITATPQVPATVPANNDTGVPTNTTIMMQFSEAVSVISKSITVTCAGKNVRFSNTPDRNTSILVLTPKSPLPTGTCTVRVPAAAVEDVDTADPPGNMTADYVFSFTTSAANTAPRVIATIPATNAGAVSTIDNITIYFSEKVKVGEKGVTIACPGVNVAFTGLPAKKTNSLVLGPTSPLPPGKKCTVTVLKTEVEDRDAPPLSMAQDYVFSFTTGHEGIFSVQGATSSKVDHYIYQDFGLLSSPKRRFYGLYSSVHFYYFPLNKNAPLKLPLNKHFPLAFLKRFSSFIGIMYLKIDADDDKGEIKNLLSFGTPVAGLGFRMDGLSFPLFRKIPLILKMTSHAKFNVGLMFFEQTDPNPLVDKTRTRADWMIGVTYDIEVQKLIGALGGILK